MRILAAVFLIFYSVASHSSGMTTVPESDRYCFGKASYCYEWALTTDPTIRFIAWGDEDGIEYTFHRKDKSGQYQYLVRIYPVLKDSSKGESLYWGYPWDIEDIALDPSGAMLATFEHDLVDDGEASSQPWQKRIPAVLFLGHTTQPDIAVPKLRFGKASLPSLQKQGANNSFKPKPLRGSA
jgi:hypothetical protein